MKLMALLMLAQAVIAATSPQPKKVLLDQDAYPEAARDAGVEGDIAFDLAIDAKGVITGCTGPRAPISPSILLPMPARWPGPIGGSCRHAMRLARKCRAPCTMQSPSAFPGAAHRPMGRRSACFSRPPGDRPAP